MSLNISVDEEVIAVGIVQGDIALPALLSATASEAGDELDGIIEQARGDWKDITIRRRAQLSDLLNKLRDALAG